MKHTVGHAIAVPPKWTIRLLPGFCEHVTFVHFINDDYVALPQGVGTMSCDVDAIWICPKMPKLVVSTLIVAILGWLVDTTILWTTPYTCRLPIVVSRLATGIDRAVTGISQSSESDPDKVVLFTFGVLHECEMTRSSPRLKSWPTRGPKERQGINFRCLFCLGFSMIGIWVCKYVYSHVSTQVRITIWMYVYYTVYIYIYIDLWHTTICKL